MSGDYMADPNREAVGLEPAWAEGYGGEPGAGPAATATDDQDLDGLTKAELLEEASRRGIDVHESATKAEIREQLETG